MSIGGRIVAPLKVLYLSAPICVHGPLARQGRTAAVRPAAGFHHHKEATLESSAADISKETLIRAMFPPREWTDAEGNTWLSFPSSELPTRDTAMQAHDHLEAELLRRQARSEPLDDVREEVFAEMFDELIRQIALLNPERGLLLLRVRDERRLTLLSLAALAYGGARFGSNAGSRIRQRGVEALEQATGASDAPRSVQAGGGSAVLAALNNHVLPTLPQSKTTSTRETEQQDGSRMLRLDNGSSPFEELSPEWTAEAAPSAQKHERLLPDTRGRGVLPARAALVTYLWPHNDAVVRASAEAAAIDRFGEDEAHLLFQLVRRAAAADILQGTAAASVIGSANTGREGYVGEDEDNVVELDYPSRARAGGSHSFGTAEGKGGEADDGTSSIPGSTSVVGAAIDAVLPVDPEEEVLVRRVVALQRETDSLRARKAELECIHVAAGARARARRHAATRVAAQQAAEDADEAGIGAGNGTHKAPSALAAALRASDSHGRGGGGSGEGAIMEHQMAVQLQRRAEISRIQGQIEALRTVLARAAAAAAAAGEGIDEDGSEDGLDVAIGLGSEPSLDSMVGFDG